MKETEYKRDLEYSDHTSNFGESVKDIVRLPLIILQELTCKGINPFGPDLARIRFLSGNLSHYFWCEYNLVRLANKIFEEDGLKIFELRHN